MGGLLRAIQTPPFDKVGFMDLETFFPAQERFKLALAINNLLASPGFAAWTRGEPLDIKRLLVTDSGRPRISILSIAHLSDTERMFFVTLLLNDLVAWMRSAIGNLQFAPSYIWTRSLDSSRRPQTRPPNDRCSRY